MGVPGGPGGQAYVSIMLFPESPLCAHSAVPPHLLHTQRTHAHVLPARRASRRTASLRRTFTTASWSATRLRASGPGWRPSASCRWTSSARAARCGHGGGPAGGIDGPAGCGAGRREHRSEGTGQRGEPHPPAFLTGWPASGGDLALRSRCPCVSTLWSSFKGNIRKSPAPERCAESYGWHLSRSPWPLFRCGSSDIANPFPAGPCPPTRATFPSLTRIRSSRLPPWSPSLARRRPLCATS